MSVTRGHVAGSMSRTIEGLREANAGLCREHAALKARVEAVLALHAESGGLHEYNCDQCGWHSDIEPCPTRRALEGKP
jgi:hypothetical protein